MTQLIIWSTLICCLHTELLQAADVLTLTGENPNVGFIDNVGTAQTWQILGNDSGLQFRDLTGVTSTPFRIKVGAPNDSLVVHFNPSSPNNCQVGIGVANPEGNLHIRAATGQATLTLQGSSGNGWGLIGSSSDFHLVDFDNVGLQAFIVKSGAPTNTLVLSNSGSVGMGTSTPDTNSRVDIRSSLTNGLLAKRADAGAHFLRVENSVSQFRCGVQGNGDTQFGALTSGKGLNLLAGGTGKVAINSSGQISFGNVPPTFTTDALIHQTGARLTNVGVWTDASSRALKQDIEPITSEQARETVRALQPVGYRYKAQPEEPYVGFIAEDVPELVATSDRKSLAPMDIVAVLTKVVQDQQTLLETQQKKLEKLEKQEAINAALMERLEVLERANAVAVKRD